MLAYIKTTKKLYVKKTCTHCKKNQLDVKHYSELHLELKTQENNTIQNLKDMKLKNTKLKDKKPNDRMTAKETNRIWTLTNMFQSVAINLVSVSCYL